MCYFMYIFLAHKIFYDNVLFYFIFLNISNFFYIYFYTNFVLTILSTKKIFYFNFVVVVRKLCVHTSAIYLFELFFFHYQLCLRWISPVADVQVHNDFLTNDHYYNSPSRRIIKIKSTPDFNPEGLYRVTTVKIANLNLQILRDAGLNMD